MHSYFTNRIVEEGKDEKERAIARNLLEANEDGAKIAAVTGLNIDDICSLKE